MNVLLIACEAPVTVAIIRALSNRHGLTLSAFWNGGAPIKPPSVRFSPTRRWRVYDHLKALDIAPLDINRRDLKEAFARQWRENKIDVIVSFGTHIIVPDDMIEAVEGRAFNFHPALLPRHGGPFPFQSLLFHEEAELYGGMTLHCMTSKIDGGPIIAQKHCPFHPGTDRQRHSLALADAAFELMQELPAVLNEQIGPREQSLGERTYFPKDNIPVRVTPGMNMGDLHRFCRTVGQYFGRFPVIPIPGAASIIASGLPRRLGNPNGQAPALTPRSIEFDIVDARVLLRRPTRLKRLHMDLSRTFYRAMKPLPG